MSSGGQKKTAQSNALSSRFKASQRKPTCILQRKLYQKTKRKSSTFLKNCTLILKPECDELLVKFNFKVTVSLFKFPLDIERMFVYYSFIERMSDLSAQEKAYDDGTKKQRSQ